MSGPSAEVGPDRQLPVPDTFSLAQTCGPAAWVGERSPRQRWVNGTLTWIGWDEDRTVWRQCRQERAGILDINGNAPQSGDAGWARAVLGIDGTMPTFTD
ncbi:MAG: hypothetical protein M3457_07855, partial [Chloroflexota bacterium]|nr:hypothetical protein [Chloroflexota bacterium]